MSMITEQIKRLRDAANRFDAEGAEPSDGDLMREATNIIEIQHKTIKNLDKILKHIRTGARNEIYGK